MTSAISTLFPDGDDERQQTPAGRNGIFPYQELRAFIRENRIWAKVEIEMAQIQPASLDLRLGEVAYRVPASFLPGPKSRVLDKVNELEGHAIDLQDGAILEKGCVYIVPLMENLRLPPPISGFANPKSTTGRLDIFTRLIADYGTRFDFVARKYEGPLYAEISPRAFSVFLRTGICLTQLRLRRGTSLIRGSRLLELHDQFRLIDTELDRREVRDRGTINLTLDLEGSAEGSIVGWKAKKHTSVLDLSRINYYDPFEFWDPIYTKTNKSILLNPDDFHILTAKESIAIPSKSAAQMLPYDTSVGEFRVHYAGFFDPGFGYSAEESQSGCRAVLEVRSHNVPFLLEHKQMVGRLRFERLTATPDRLYGSEMGSSYQGQGLKLAKQFKAPS